jgi:GH24 family phage-related lysozyme (muramidase)
MKKNSAISESGLSLIKTFEGFRSNATRLPNDVWVIGHGHTASARAGTKVDLADAETLLVWDMNQLAPKIHNCIFAPLDVPQMDALLSLAFNIGIENFSNSDVVRYLNEGNTISAAGAFEVWRRAKIGKRVMVIDALVRRRAAEKAHFLDVKSDSIYAPSALLHPQMDYDFVSSIEIETAKQVVPSANEVEVSIDLNSSAALGSLLGPVDKTPDGEKFSFETDNAIDPSLVFSDDDVVEEQEESKPVEVVQGLPFREQEETPKEKSSEDLVKMEDVFVGDKAVESTRELAEKISDRGSEVTELVTDAEPPLEKATLSTNDEDLEAAANPSQQTSHGSGQIFDGNSEWGFAKGLKTDKPPKEAVEEPPKETDLAQETSAAEETDQGLNPASIAANDEPSITEIENLPPVIDNSEPTPANLTSELSELEEQPFEVVQKRNTGMFVLIGIAGLILGIGGVYETMKSGYVVTTLWDMVKGPGFGLTGALMVLAALYFLIRRALK